MQQELDFRGVVVEAGQIHDAFEAAWQRFREGTSGDVQRAADQGSDSGEDESSSEDCKRFHVVEVGPGMLQVGILESSGHVHSRCARIASATRVSVQMTVV